MTKELATIENDSVLSSYSSEQLSLIRLQVAPRATEDELIYFLLVAKKRGLDPLAKQIYAIHRETWDPVSRNKTWKMTIQTAIDGFRVVADRSGTYAPGNESWQSDNGEIVSATVSIRKLVGGTWIEFAATAFMDEYAQRRKDHKTGEMVLSDMWARMPRTMLAKCAEAKALRKGWPEQLSGLYVNEEMQQADNNAANQFANLPLENESTKLIPISINGQSLNYADKQPARTVSYDKPKPGAANLPPVPEQIFDIPMPLFTIVKAWAGLEGVALPSMDDADLELIKDQASEFYTKAKKPEFKAWFQALAAESAALLRLRSGVVPPPGDDDAPSEEVNQ